MATLSNHLKLAMYRNRSESGWRTASLAAALFAITINFLQPLAHAALMRNGGPEAAAKLWGVFCLAATAQDDADAPVSPLGNSHECCLGVAHVPALIAPSTAFILAEPAVTAIHGVTEFDALSPVGIRDGPSQPRAPPALV